jgi:hypothetical protein
MDKLVEAVALAMINRDRDAGGWPEVASREAIQNSDGYAECAKIAIAATFTHIREQAERDDVFQAAVCLGDVPIWDKFTAMLDQIEGTDNAS